MSLPVQLDDEAILEFDGAVRWYEQRNADAALRFTHAVNAALKGIVEYPDRWPFEIDDIRTCPVPDWTFAIYYRIEQKQIRVLAVFHTSRDPQEWMGRI
jgi:plasmid stabilization system protein ParE